MRAISMSLEGRHVLAVVAPVGFQDDELRETTRALEIRGAAVEVASGTAGPARGERGTEPGGG